MKTNPEFVTPTTLEPGWYQDIPEAIYHHGPGWKDLCSNSFLTTMHNSAPARASYERAHPKEETDSMILGTATHFAILQPELFDTRYYKRPEGNGATKAVKNAREAAALENPGKIALAKYEECLGMAAAVWENLDARIFLESPGQLEVSGIWDDEETGIRQKMRIDKLCEDLHATVDLKSCRSAHPRDFEREIYARGYHRQGATYIDGAKALGIDVTDHVIIAVENKAPHLTVVYRLKREAIELGREQLRPLKQTYKQCKESGYWSGYPEGLVWVGVPDWAYNLRENENE